MAKVSKKAGVRAASRLTGKAAAEALVSGYHSTLDTVAGDRAAVEREHVAERLRNLSKPATHRRRASGGRASFLEANPKKSYLADPDVFNRLVPLWQLHLYFERNGHPGFYADVMEKMRLMPEGPGGDDSIKNQFEFIKICCDVGKTDLTDFFEGYGYFRTGELEVNDYAKYHFKITPEMVAETKACVAAKHYPKPVVDPSTMED